MTPPSILRGGVDLDLVRSYEHNARTSQQAETAPTLPIFCDWLSMTVPAENVPAYFDRWIESRTDSGALQWSRPAWTQIRDNATSSSTKIQVRHNREAGILKIDGNLGRFGSTDNVWGRGVYAAGASFIDLLTATHGIRQTGPATLSRVDLTMNIAFDSSHDAYDWLRWAHTVKLGRTSPTPYPTGVAWHTRRWYAKVYDKIADLKRHKMIALANTIESQVGYLLRPELTLRTHELAHEALDTLPNWIQETDKMNVIFTERFKPLLQGRGVSIDELARSLPLRLANALDGWRNGRNFQQSVIDGLISKSTYMRLKRELLAQGVDISVPCNVTTLGIRPRDITAQPVAAPDWYRKAA